MFPAFLFILFAHLVVGLPGPFYLSLGSRLWFFLLRSLQISISILISCNCVHLLTSVFLIRSPIDKCNIFLSIFEFQVGLSFVVVLLLPMSVLKILMLGGCSCCLIFNYCDLSISMKRKLQNVIHAIEILRFKSML